jgi:hypothetical protein
MAVLMLLALSLACSKKSADPITEDDPPPPPADSSRSYGTHVNIGLNGNSEYPSFDFGYAPQQSEITHVFWLHNAADDSMYIYKVLPG